MTFSITLAFIVRSSSLIGWIPIAAITIFNGNNACCVCRNLGAILLSGICVTIPMCLFSIMIDSFYYGRFLIPQYNFVHANVVLDLATGFGKEPFDYYLIEMREFLNSIEKERLSFLGLSMLTVY